MVVDLERGRSRRPSERLVRLIKAWGTQRRAIVIITTAWIAYCTMAFGRGRGWTPRLARLVPPDGLKMYSDTVADAQRISTISSELYSEPSVRFPGFYSLDTINTLLTQVMRAHEWDCLAAIHLGIPVQVARVGATLIINPTNIVNAAETRIVDEESAFFPHAYATVRRHTETGLTSNGQNYHFAGQQAICAQHLVEAMGVDGTGYIGSDTGAR